MVKKRKPKKLMKTTRKIKAKMLPPGTYQAKVVAFDIESGKAVTAFRGQVDWAPKTLKAALKHIASLELLRLDDRREHEKALKAKDLENVTLRLQAVDHFANRILNIMEEGSRKGNFPIRAC